MANNKSGQAVSPLNGQQQEWTTIPIETDCNFEKQTDNYKLQQANKFKSQQANKFKSQQAPAPAPTSGTQNIQGDNGKQANNFAFSTPAQFRTQHQPNFAFSQTAPAPATAPETSASKATTTAPETSASKATTTAPNGTQNIGIQGDNIGIKGDNNTQSIGIQGYNSGTQNFGTQNIQGDYSKQANNSGTQDHPTFTF